MTTGEEHLGTLRALYEALFRGDHPRDHIRHEDAMEALRWAIHAASPPVLCSCGSRAVDPREARPTRGHAGDCDVHRLWDFVADRGKPPSR